MFSGQREAERQRVARWRAAHPKRAVALNRRRIFIGHTYHSACATVEQAAQINAHIKRRLREFVA